MAFETGRDWALLSAINSSKDSSSSSFLTSYIVDNMLLSPAGYPR